MTTDVDGHPLVLDVTELHLTIARAFNAGDHALMEALFEPGAIFVPEPGTILRDDERRRSTGAFIDRGIPMQLTPRHTYVADDIALLISDYRFDITAADGTASVEEGTSTDVARRGADGGWRLVIDNPPGTDRPSDA